MGQPTVNRKWPNETLLNIYIYILQYKPVSRGLRVNGRSSASRSPQRQSDTAGRVLPPFSVFPWMRALPRNLTNIIRRSIVQLLLAHPRVACHVSMHMSFYPFWWKTHPSTRDERALPHTTIVGQPGSWATRASIGQHRSRFEAAQLYRKERHRRAQQLTYSHPSRATHPVFINKKKANPARPTAASDTVTVRGENQKRSI